jgi:photosystem II stability/assembly factor-like uncharacterized protein
MKRSAAYVTSALVCLLLILFLSTQAQAGDDAWTTTGPYGATIRGLAVDPHNSQVIYAIAPYANAFAYKSTDGGTSWSPSGVGLQAECQVCSIAVDPRNSQTIYVANRISLAISTDAGATWKQQKWVLIDGVEKPLLLASIAISPLDGTLYGGQALTFFSEYMVGGIYRSRDRGDTWEVVATSTATDFEIRQIIVAPSAPHIIYAGGGGQGGIFKSTDAGDTWRAIDSAFMSRPSVRYLAVDPYNSQVVYIVTSGGLYKTTNGGQAWFPIGDGLSGLELGPIAVDPRDQQTIYLGTNAGVYRSLDNEGKTWVPMTTGMAGRAATALAIDSSTPKSIYAGSGAGVWKFTVITGSRDYSVSINDGNLFTNETAVTLKLTAPSGTTHVMISNDGGFGGAVWEPFSTHKAWTITEYGEQILPRIVYARFRSNGLTSGLYQDDIILDTVPPKGSVQIVDPVVVKMSTTAAYTVGRAEPTSEMTHTAYLPLALKQARRGFALVGLALSATDGLSGVADALIANDAGFGSGEWVAYAPHVNWWVPEGGTTVYVRYRDRAGNLSEVYSASATP